VQCPWIDQYSAHWPVEAIAKQFFANKKSHANDKSTGRFSARQARNGRGKQCADNDDDLEEGADAEAEAEAEADDNEADDDEANDDEAGEPDPNVGGRDATPAETSVEDDEDEEPPTPPPWRPVKHNKRTIPVGESRSPFYTSVTLVSFLTCAIADSESEVDDSAGK
jgi:hypothetical protein